VVTRTTAIGANASSETQWRIVGSSLANQRGQIREETGPPPTQISTPSRMMPQILHLDPQAGLDSNDANDPVGREIRDAWHP
jgi:hypothetical protein